MSLKLSTFKLIKMEVLLTRLYSRVAPFTENCEIAHSKNKLLPGQTFDAVCHTCLIKVLQTQKVRILEVMRSDMKD